MVCLKFRVFLLCSIKSQLICDTISYTAAPAEDGPNYILSSSQVHTCMTSTRPDVQTNSPCPITFLCNFECSKCDFILFIFQLVLTDRDPSVLLLLFQRLSYRSKQRTSTFSIPNSSLSVAVSVLKCHLLHPFHPFCPCFLVLHCVWGKPQRGPSEFQLVSYCYSINVSNQSLMLSWPVMHLSQVCKRQRALNAPHPHRAACNSALSSATVIGSRSLNTLRTSGTSPGPFLIQKLLATKTPTGHSWML